MDVKGDKSIYNFLTKA